MSQIDLIRAEIESKRDQNREGENSYYDVNDIKNAGICRHKRILCEHFLSFLDTLEEQPVEIDIRKELASIEFMGVNDARDTETIARHFYELGRQSKEQSRFPNWYPNPLEEQPVCEELEEAADAYVMSQDNFPADQREHLYAFNAFKAGWLACKDHMMKEAMEGRVFVGTYVSSIEIPAPLIPFDYNGTKVKLIIIKED